MQRTDNEAQLMHPILDALNGTPHEWIKKLLFTFNEGNIGKFEALAPLFPREVCASCCWRGCSRLNERVGNDSHFCRSTTPSCGRRSA